MDGSTHPGDTLTLEGEQDGGTPLARPAEEVAQQDGSRERTNTLAQRVDAAVGRTTFVLPVVLLLFFGVRPAPDPRLREDEVHCEEAKAHLIECCESFTSNLRCRYQANDDCEPPTYPDLEAAESRAVERMSCAEVNLSDYCSRVFDHSRPDDSTDGEY